MVMLIGFLTVAAQRLRSLKAPLLVVAFSALFALLFTLATRPGSPEPSAVAGAAEIRLMNDEHALVADYVRGNVEAERAAGLAADRDRSAMRSLAVAEAAQHAAMVAAPVPKAAPKVSHVAAQVAQVAQVPLPPRPLAAAGPPLTLQATVVTPSPPRRAPVADGARAVIATVGRIPHWVRVGVQEAANWVIVAPVQTLARLPERRFL
jgi:hypothetical protein